MCYETQQLIVFNYCKLKRLPKTDANLLNNLQLSAFCGVMYEHKAKIFKLCYAIQTLRLILVFV